VQGEALIHIEIDNLWAEAEKTVDRKYHTRTYHGNSSNLIHFMSNAQRTSSNYMGQMGQVCLASLSFVGAHSVSRISTEWGVLVQ
jgi:hypothetical protein